MTAAWATWMATRAVLGCGDAMPHRCPRLGGWTPAAGAGAHHRCDGSVHDEQLWPAGCTADVAVAGTQFNESSTVQLGDVRRVVRRRGVGAAVLIVFLAVEAVLVAVGAVALTAAADPPGLPRWLGWSPVGPALVAWVCLSVAAVLAAAWVLRRGRPGHGISALLAGLDAALVGFGAVAFTAATADPPAWPALVAFLPIAPALAAVASFVAGIVLAVVTVWWGTRSPAVDLSGLFTSATQPALSPAGLLRADQAVVRFRGVQRSELLAELRAWCVAGDTGLAVRIVAGGGGQGKTRLARELVNCLPRGWQAGLVRTDPPPQALAQLGRLSRPVLLVLDYAEARTALITALVTALTRRPVRVRLLLLARGAGEWRRELAATSDLLEMIAACPVHLLGPVEAQLLGRQHAWREAVTDLAARLPAVPGYATMPWSQIGQSLVTGAAPALAGARFGPVLALHMHALASLLHAGGTAVYGDAASQSSEEVLLRHEQRYWSSTATRFGLAIQPAAAGGLTPTTLRTAVAAATVFGARSQHDAVAIAANLPGLNDLGAHGHQAVAEWLATTYPQDQRYWGPLQPDPLGEHLAASVLHTTPDAFDEPAAVATPEQWQRALTVLSRCADTHPEMDRCIDTLVTANPVTAAAAALTVAVEVVRPQPLLTALDHILDAASDPDVLHRLDDALPHHTQLHRDLAARVTAALVAEYRARCQADGDAFLPDLATSLNNLSVRLGDLGRREEGLAASQEATATYRRLAQERPDAFLPDLATSLNNLSVRLGDLGRREEGLAASQEATATYRRLAQERPDAFLPDLATSLNNLSLRLGDLGRREEGLAAIEEATAIRRRLAQERPDAFLPDLATSLNNLSVDLGALGRREEGLAAIEEATAIRRRLAQERPDAFLPDLAGSLNNLSVRLGALGRREEGLAAIEEATATYRRLAQERPDAFLPDLAGSLNNLSVRLGALGRREEGLAASQEATATYRRLAQERPDAFLPDLAMSLNNLSVDLGDLGRREEGLAAIEEATAIRRRLAQERPDAFLPDLAMSLNNLSVRLGDLGRREEGLAAIEEATATYRRLAQERPDAFLPDLAMSLNNLSVDLGALGRREEGLAAIEEATAIYRRLAQERPDAFLPDLAMSLNNLSVDLGDLGRREEGLAAIEEATAIRRRLAQERPDAFLPDLATSLNNLSNRLRDFGRNADAADAAEEANRIRASLPTQTTTVADSSG